jgi:queuine tRNA-ribosyltransferase
MAVVPDPDGRWRIDLAKGRFKRSAEPLLEGCPCPGCATGYTRGYLHYLIKNREPTAMRVLTLHNIAYLQRLMAGLREALLAGRLAEHAAGLRGGAAP